MLACSSASVRAQDAPADPPADFDLGSTPIDPEALLVTNAAQDAADAECVPSDDPDRIVVCAADPMRYRIDSSLDEATAKGEAARDGMPRAPELAPSCRTTGGACMRVGATPYRPLLIDLDAIPQPLPVEVAEKVRYALTPEQMEALRRQAGLTAPAISEGTPGAGEEP